MFKKTFVRGLLAAAFAATVMLFATARAASAQGVFNMPNGETSLSFVAVGNPGNSPDPSTGYGAVSGTFYMGKYDVTVGQYCQFLNAVATTSDPYGLYNPSMAPGSYYGFPTLGISQNGSPNNYSYLVTGSYSQGVKCPIFDITWGDAARFCNWLQNGQPSAPEGNGTTETGAYTLSGTATNWMAVTRNAGATYFIPSEDEWYKAAYYDPTLNGGTGGYWLYPTKSNTPPGNTLPGTGNNANYYISGYTDATNYLTPVGSFVLSPGPYGTYDMGGDVLQWNDADITSLCRGLRGGAFDAPGFDVYYPSSYNLASYNRDYYNYPNSVNPDVGFRVASSEAVPEPDSIALLAAGSVALIGYCFWCRRNCPALPLAGKPTAFGADDLTARTSVRFNSQRYWTESARRAA